MPEVGHDVPSALAVERITGQDTNAIIAPSIEEYRERTKEVEAIFRRIRDRLPVELVTPDTLLCDTSLCKVVIDGVALYRDDDHLSLFGSEYISKSFDNIFDNPKKVNLEIESVERYNSAPE